MAPPFLKIFGGDSQPPVPDRQFKIPAVNRTSFSRPTDVPINNSSPTSVDRSPRSSDVEGSTSSREEGTEQIRIDSGQSKDNISSFLNRFANLDPSELFIEIRNGYASISKDAFDFSKGTLSKLRNALKASSDELCSDCSKLPFKDFLPGQDSRLEPYACLRPLRRLLADKDRCPFCILLYESLCRPQHDPLRHAEVQEYLPHRLRGMSFAEWQSMTLPNKLRSKVDFEGFWPFGISADEKDRAHSQGVTALTTDSAQSRVATSRLEQAIWAGTRNRLQAAQLAVQKKQAKVVLEAIESTLTAGAMRWALARKPLGCWLKIELFDGVIRVQLLGFTRKPRSLLTTLSDFSLRLASEAVQAFNRSLRYGRLVGPELDYRLIGEWFRHCKTQHEGCCKPTGPTMVRRDSLGKSYARFIDVTDDCLRTLDTDATEYVALSYVWGEQKSNMRLTNASQDRYTRIGGLSGHVNDLPRTILHAIRVVRLAGFRYLWVDQMCIVQDDEKDKHAQIHNMNNIYQNAQFTIVAGSGRSVNDGLLRPDRLPNQVVRQVRPNINVLVPLQQPERLEPWQSRGWTLQEKLLSRRLLVFSDGFMSWHCRGEVAFEDMTAMDILPQDHGSTASPLFSSDIPQHDDARPFDVSALVHQSNGRPYLCRPVAFQKYADLVQDLTRRDLSYEDDILDAVEGLLPPFCRALGWPHIGGIPQGILDLALLWQPAQDSLKRRHKAKNGSMFPSWSWAGWVGPIKYESTFSVLTSEEGKLVKLIDSTATQIAHERVRPVVRWYVTPDSSYGSATDRAPPPVPPKKPISRFTVSSSRTKSVLALPPDHQTDRRSSLPPRPRPKPAPYSTPNATSNNLPSVPDKPKALSAPKPIGLLASFEQKRPEGWRSYPTPVRGESVLLPEGAALWSATTGPFCRRTYPVRLPECTGHTCLIFRSQIARFRIGKQVLRQELHKVPAKAEPLSPNATDATPQFEIKQVSVPQNEVLDWKGRVVGAVRLHERGERFTSEQDFVVISEAAFAGDERQIGGADFPLYNVLLVRRDGELCSRIGLGKIYKTYWDAAGPREELVVLS